MNRRCQRFLAMTLIEIKIGRQVRGNPSMLPGVEPVFPEKRWAIDYAKIRAKSQRRYARGAIDLSRLLGS